MHAKRTGFSMFVATVLTAPSGASLDPDLVRNLRNAWGGGDVTWLSIDQAAEFPVSDVPTNRWDIWRDLQDIGVDLVVQKAEGRRKRVLLADMDSTMIQQECIDELADVAGVGARVKEITARAMNGELDFESALIERVSVLKGLDATIVDQVLRDRISLVPGGATLVATMRRDGAYAALVSGGFTAFTRSVASQLGFDENRANTLIEKDGVLTGEVERPILGRDAKVQALGEIVAKHGLSNQDVLAVGDGANDLGMLELAGTGVALHAKPAVAAECDVRINHGDLTALLFLQGYAESDFANLEA